MLTAFIVISFWDCTAPHLFFIIRVLGRIEENDMSVVLNLDVDGVLSQHSISSCELGLFPTLDSQGYLKGILCSLAHD